MPEDDVTPPAPMLRDFAAEMVVDPPAAPEVDDGNDRTTLDGKPLILPVDADEGPADLDEVVQSFTGAVAEKAVAELDGTDRLLHPVRCKVRATIEPILADHAERLADIQNRSLPPGPLPSDGDAIRLLGGDGVEGLPVEHPTRKAFEAIQRRIRERGTLTPDGARLEIQDATRERDAAIQTHVENWREQLDAVEARCADVLSTHTINVDEDQRREALLLTHELRDAGPRHGLPKLAWMIREAAVDETARGTVAAALPTLRALYEDARGPFGGSVQLRTLIGKANDLMIDADVAVAQARLERIERTRFEIDQFIQNAVSGGVEALDDEGRPVLLPPEAPPRPVPMPQSAPYQFRRASSAGQRAADEQRRRELREAEE